MRVLESPWKVLDFIFSKPLWPLYVGLYSFHLRVWLADSVCTRRTVSNVVIKNRCIMGRRNFSEVRRYRIYIKTRKYDEHYVVSKARTPLILLVVDLLCTTSVQQTHNKSNKWSLCLTVLVRENHILAVLTNDMTSNPYKQPWLKKKGLTFSTLFKATVGRVYDNN